MSWTNVKHLRWTVCDRPTSLFYCVVLISIRTTVSKFGKMAVGLQSRLRLGGKRLLWDSIDVPITSILDLHTFRPSDVGDLVPTYLAECRERGMLQVRIIHGKGIGALRETVHAILRRMPEVSVLPHRVHPPLNHAFAGAFVS